jgi:hypothetical protein
MGSSIWSQPGLVQLSTWLHLSSMFTDSDSLRMKGRCAGSWRLWYLYQCTHALIVTSGLSPETSRAWVLDSGF